MLRVLGAGVGLFKKLFAQEGDLVEEQACGPGQKTQC